MRRPSFRKYGRRAAIAIAALLVVCLLGVAVTWQHWWWREYSAHVYINGKLSPDGRVYLQNDHLMACTGEPLGSSVFPCYILQRSKWVWSRSVGFTGGKNLIGLRNLNPVPFVFVPWAAFALNVPPYVTPMNTAKLDVNPELRSSTGTVEFTTLPKNRCTVRL